MKINMLKLLRASCLGACVAANSLIPGVSLAQELAPNDQNTQPSASKPELNVQPIATISKGADTLPAHTAAVVKDQPIQPNNNPLDEVAQGLGTTPTPLPVKPPVSIESKTQGTNSSVASNPSVAQRKPTSLKPLGPSIKNVQGEKLAQATGHFARARSLLIAALGEFDKGLELANPDALFSSTEWRTNVTARARDIEHILAPQPRETTGGIKFQADPRLLGEAKR